MLKKILLGLLLVGLAGGLVAGAANRTLAKAATDEAYGGGRGNGGGQGSGQAYTGDLASEGQSDGAGTGQAEVDEWLTLTGTVTAADAGLLAVDTAGGEITVENRAWSYAQEQGFAAQVGDQVALTGFYENDLFEVGRIDNLATGQTVTLRDENGRPMWAGRGRRGG